MDKMLERILEIIPKKHGSKKELADAIGIPANLITDWKAGRAKSYPKYAAAIADYYNVSLDWLSGRSEQKEKPTPVSESGPSYPPEYDLLTPENKAMIDRLIAELAKQHESDL